ncbi:MAG: signal peptide peptidase SppA [Phycisphaerales bacterium]|nr:signal peptide peptidase SppA [Phycisphaerales bacterium]
MENCRAGWGRAVGFAGAIGAALLLGGCLPTSVTVSLRGGREKLEQVVVLADPGAPTAKVAMIDVRGLIADVSTPTLLGEGPNPVDEVVTRLIAAEQDSAVKAVVLRISSPGGTVTASDILYREVEGFRSRTKKPVVVSMGEIAASGGYYLSLAGDRILAEPTTLTGSIGVIIPSINFSEGLNRIGIKSRSIKSGANKDLANPLEPIRESQYAVLQNVVDEFYAKFRGLVVARRPGLKAENLADATDGRIITGARAAELGLVDGLGGVRDAFAAAKELAGVKSGTLVKFTYGGAEGMTRSPYAGAGPGNRPVLVGPGSGETEVNLMQVKVEGPGGAAMEGAGVYYLWGPQWWAE